MQIPADDSQTRATQAPPHVLACVDDLFFQVKISDAARQSGMRVTAVSSEEAALEQAKCSPALAIVDLNVRGTDPLRLIRELKAMPEMNGVAMVAYVSHVQADLIQSAREAGCDVVLARSAFSQNLPRILKEYARQS